MEKAGKHYLVVKKGNRDQAAVFEGSMTNVENWLHGLDNQDLYEIYCSGTGVYLDVRTFKSLFRSQFVDKFYSMDPDTEDFLPNSDHLANGMVVLMGDVDRRASKSDMTMRWGVDRALVRNRWCTVTKLTKQANDDYKFVAIYDDGSKRTRYVHRTMPWLVKQTSIDSSAAEETERYRKILYLVSDAMRQQEEAAFNEYVFSRDRVAKNTTSKILGIL